MEYNREQRDMLVAGMQVIANSKPASSTDRVVQHTIVPAMRDLAKDCNELEDKLNQALAINETLRDVIRSIASDKDMSGEGPN